MRTSGNERNEYRAIRGGSGDGGAKVSGKSGLQRDSIPDRREGELNGIEIEILKVREWCTT